MIAWHNFFKQKLTFVFLRIHFQLLKVYQSFKNHVPFKNSTHYDL